MNGRTVPLPERLGRRMSIGPFEDPRDFLRCLLVVTAGALAALAWGILALLPFLALGGVLTLLRSNDESWWSLLTRRLRYETRPRSRLLPVLPRWPPRARVVGDTWYDLAGRGWEVWEGPCSPIYGRNEEALLAEARDLLREVARFEAELVLYRVPFPCDLAGHLPASRGFSRPEEKLRQGYRSLLLAASRGKVRPRILLALPRNAGTPGRERGTETTSGALEGLIGRGWTRRTGAGLRDIMPEIAAPFPSS